MDAYLSAIFVYPIKSLDGILVPDARVVGRGGIENDRRFAMFEANGEVVNGKRYPSVHRVRSSVEGDRVALRVDGDSARGVEYRFGEPSAALEEWLSNYLGTPVHWREDRGGGFPDDTDAPGPTVISEATLAEVALWIPAVSGVEEMRERLRPNLIIAGVPAFWEDRLYSEKGSTVRFRIGDVEIDGVNPCARCPVPSRNPRTGEIAALFQKTVAQRREATLPAWANRSRFDHFYRLAVNTVVPDADSERVFRVGDPVTIP